MGALIGPVGGLQEVRCASSLEIAPVGPEVLSITETVGGAEFVQVSMRGRSRQWGVDVATARPHEMTSLVQMTRRTRTHQETLVFYSEDAQVENLLDPDASLMGLAGADGAKPGRTWSGLSQGGARLLPGVHLPGPRFEVSGVTSPDGQWGALSGVPVPHLRTVTASIYVTAFQGQTAHFHVVEVGMDGQPVRTHETSTRVGSDGEAVLDRLAHTFDTTPQTVAVTLAVAGAATVVAPQLTLTDRPVEWADGQGCVSAVLMARPSKRVQAAYMAPNDIGRRSAYSWQVREVQNL